MNIGFDLDGIFIDRPPFVPRWLIEWLYRGPQNHEPKYRFPSTKIEQSIRKLSHYSLLRPKISQNIEFLEQFCKDKKNNLFLITSRYHFLENETLNILKKYNVDKCFSKMYLNDKNEQPHLFKSRIIGKLNLSIFVDDDLKLLLYLQKDYPKLKLLWYNQKSTSNLPPGIIQIKNLKEVYNYIK